MKYGNVIDAETMRQAGIEDVSTAELAKEAFRAMGGKADEECIERVNGMKEEYGSGIATLITIYNALGCSLHYKETRDWSGHRGKYDYDSPIYNGEWSCALHVKTSGTATGSCGVIAYNLRGGYGDQDVLVVSWVTPFSGPNKANCFCANIKTYDATSWDKIEEWANRGYPEKDHDLGLIRVRATIGQNSSPILRVVASQKVLF
jgi:hypothetical protein